MHFSKKFFMLGALLMLASSVGHASFNSEMRGVVIPYATGALSGAIYGHLIKKGDLFNLVVAKVLLGSCKERFFELFDKDQKDSLVTYAMQQVTTDEGITTYQLTIEENKASNASTKESDSMSYVDDFITFAAMCMVLWK